MAVTWKLKLGISVYLIVILYMFVKCSSTTATTKDKEENDAFVKPSVMIALLIRNKAHSLPYMLGYVENLNYPKDRISIWIRSDHNEDNSSAILNEWTNKANKIYHSVSLKVNDEETDYGEHRPLEWPEERFDQVMKLRQRALKAARKAWADYILYLDGDVLLANRDTLSVLMDKKKTIVSPMMNISDSSSTYSNFWGGMRPTGYYDRVSWYFPILYRYTEGCFQVPMVHSVMLIDLRHQVSRRLTFYPTPADYTGPHDDIIQFALTTNASGIPMYILNTDFFGHMAQPLPDTGTLSREREVFRHVKIEAMVEGDILQVSKYISLPPVYKDTLGFDEVYMINLKRRPDRRRRMLATLHELGVRVRLVDAVDGSQINASYLEDLGIVMLPEYADPYWDRRLTHGEIGCFMSHYNIWLDVIEKQYKKVLILEDDVRFEILFREKLNEALSDATRVVPNWDLIYVGRKILKESERFVEPGKTNLVYPAYTYWTLSYALTARGAHKLVDAKPLGKMVPVDEYLPIMYDQHDNQEWSAHYPTRDLVTLSVNPLLVAPTHYVGDSKYFSDTETSEVIPQESIIFPVGPPVDSALQEEGSVLGGAKVDKDEL